jgi:hypothetical protein
MHGRQLKATIAFDVRAIARLEALASSSVGICETPRIGAEKLH